MAERRRSSYRKSKYSSSQATSVVVNEDTSAGNEYALLPMVVRGIKMTSAAIFVWSWGYFGFSIAWMYVPLCFYIAAKEFRKIHDSKKLYALQANLNEKEAILSRVDEHPSWVFNS